jgi:transcriptional regulator with GAF, ATPase, and Fis domain
LSTNNIDVYAEIAELARLVSERLPHNSAIALEELIHNVVDHIPAADYAGVTIVARRDQVETPAATHAHPRTLDRLQQKHGQGPCMDAATEHEIVYLRDLEADRRWPQFQRDALIQTPIRSVLSFQLFTTRHTCGALNIYSDTAHAFEQVSRDLGRVFAAHAAIVWTSVQQGEQFQSALASRDIIGQAKGMIMERYTLDAGQAFELLRKLSQNENIRIADIARKLVEHDHPMGQEGAPLAGNAPAVL